MPRLELSRDSLERERRGRIVGDDQHRAAIRARARELLRANPGGDGVQRSRPSSSFASPGFAAGKGTSREAVLKIVSWTKNSASPMAQAKYASRTRESDPQNCSLSMVNEEGRELRGDEIEAEIRSWGLRTDAENLSAAARQATGAERREMSVAERLDKRQAVHIIFSVPARAQADAERLGRAVDLALRETVNEGGFRYLYTVHTDHSARPHAHIVVKAQSEPFEKDGRRKTRQLRLGPRELDAIRQVFTRHAQEQGLNVIATRRQDREHLRADILAGAAPLRETMKYHQAMKQTRQGRTFEVKAPNWYAEHGLDYERRRLAAASLDKPANEKPSRPIGVERGPSAQTTPEDRTGNFLRRLFDRVAVGGRSSESSYSAADTESSPVPKRGGYYRNFENYRKGTSPEQKITSHFVVTHSEPDKAEESFRTMFREAPRLALWAAHEHPQAFGDTNGREGPGIAWRDIRMLASAPRQGAISVEPQRDTLDYQGVLAGERLALRDATARARASAAPAQAQLTMVRSLNRFADRVERDTSSDPDSKEHAAHIRAVARNLGAGPPPTREQPLEQGERIRTEAGKEDKAVLYRELEQQLRQRDEARAKNRTRDRDDGRSDR